MDNRATIRRTMRAARNKLSNTQQHKLALSAGQLLTTEIAKLNIKHVALYLAYDGELNTAPAITSLWQQKIHVYLPIVHPFTQGQLIFQQYLPDTVMRSNKYGIFEPKLNVNHICPLSQLQLIVTPLVAFDKKGNRLGMGGGFYDRTLTQTYSPTAIGYAYDCQQVERLPTASWDMPCQTIITPSEIYQFDSPLPAS